MQLDTAHGQRHLVKMFEHLMVSVRIMLCLESHETIIELSVRTSTHTHYVNNIIYIYLVGTGSSSVISEM